MLPQGRSLLHALTFVALSVLAAPCPATAAAPDTSTVEIEGVTVLGTHPLATRGGSSAFRAALDSLPIPALASMEQALRALPGIHVRTNSRGEAELSVRGSESRQVAVLVDGAPLTLSWDGRTDPSILPAASLQRVTFTRGLSTLLAGPNVLGGVVEFESAPVGVDVPTALRLRSGVDEVGAYGISGAVTAPRALASGGVLTLRAGLGHRDSPGRPLARGLVEPLPDGDLRVNTDVTETDAFASARLDRGDGSWLALSSSAFRAERGIAAELDVSEPRCWRYPYVARSLTVLSGGSGVHRVPWGGSAGLRASVGADVGRTEIDAYDSRAYTALASQEDGDQRTYSFRALGTQTLGSRADLRLGVTSGDMTYDEHLDPGATSRYHQRLWSLAGETVVRFPTSRGPLDEVDVSLGGAFDRATYPLAGGKTALGPREEWGGRVGVSAQLAGRRLALHASANRRARFPSLRELYSGALGRFLPNPELRPEKLVAGEAGLTLRGASGTLQLNGFHQRLDDAVVRVSVGRLFRRVNQEGLRSTGFEAIVSRVAGPLSLAADMTGQSVELLDPGALAHPENLPEWSGGLHAEIDLPRRLTFGATARYLGEQYALDPDSGILATLPDRARLDLELARSWSVGRAAAWFSTLEARVAVDNLGDEVIYGAFGLPEPGRVVRFELRLQ